jgi:hypothetical protein
MQTCKESVNDRFKKHAYILCRRKAKENHTKETFIKAHSHTV